MGAGSHLELDACSTISVSQPPLGNSESYKGVLQRPYCALRLRLIPHAAMEFLPFHLFRRLSGRRAVLNHLTVSWSRSTLVRTSCTRLPQVEGKPLVLRASEFRHLFEEGPTERIYASTPMSGLGQAQQGKILQEWARKVLHQQNPLAQISDPQPGQCCNGNRRGRHQAEYDFLMGGRRVEVKSTRLVWDSTHRRWGVQFQAVKMSGAERNEAAFDDLYLVIASPVGLHLIKHDLSTGVCKCGKATALIGHRVQVYAGRSSACWKEALETILRTLCQQGRCTLIDENGFSHPSVKGWLLRAERETPFTVQARLLADIPMGRMSKEKRGKRIEEIGLALDRRLHPRSEFSFAEGNRGKANAPADWVRGTVLVELKSCRLTFDRTYNRWRCQFVRIKPGLFDELWLAIFTLVGIYYFRSKSCKSLGLCNAGAAMQTQGHQLYFYGPRGEVDLLEAFKTIQAKMALRGYELVAIVERRGTARHTPARL